MPTAVHRFLQLPAPIQGRCEAPAEPFLFWSILSPGRKPATDGHSPGLPVLVYAFVQVRVPLVASVVIFSSARASGGSNTAALEIRHMGMRGFIQRREIEI